MRKLSTLLLLVLLLGSLGQAKAELFPGRSPAVDTLTLTNANTEYFYVFPERTIEYAVKARQGNDFKYSFASGSSGTTYRTVPAGSEVYGSPVFLYGSNRTIYVQSTVAGTIIEIEYWKDQP